MSLNAAELDCFFRTRPDILIHYGYYGWDTSPGNYAPIARNWFTTLKTDAALGKAVALAEHANQFSALEDYVAFLGCKPAPTFIIPVPPNTSPGSGGSIYGPRAPLDGDGIGGQWQQLTKFAQKNPLIVAGLGVLAFLVFYKPGSIELSR